MTELVLIVALEGLALALVVVLVRLHRPRPDAIGTGRVISALERASAAFLASERLRLAPLAGALALVLFALEAALGRPAQGLGRAAGVLAGAALGALVTAGAARASGLAGGAALDAARSRFDTALSAALRLGGATGLGAQAVGVLGAMALLAGEQALGGGAAPGLMGVAAAGSGALACYAVGAALAAFMGDRAASLYGAAASAGAHRAELGTPPVGASDARNPALVAGLVGGELRVGAQATRQFAVTATFAVLSLLLPARLGLVAENASRLTSLGLVIPAFGVVACVAGVLVSRTEEAAHPGAALLRGLCSAAAVSAFGVIASSYWLFPESWPWLAGAGALGLVVSALAGASLYPALGGGSASVREAQSALRAGAGPSSAVAFAVGLRHAAVVAVLLAGGALGSQALGTASGLAEGARIGPFVALAAAVSLLPFVLGVSALANVAEGSLGILAMAPADAEVSRRARRLEDTARAASAAADTTLTGATGLAAASIGLTLGAQGDAAGSTPLLLAVSAIAGAAFVLSHGSLALGAAVRGTRDASLEVDRQLEAPSGRPDLRGAAPSYRSCEEQCSRAGLDGALSGGLLACLPLVLLGIALDLVYRGKSPRLAAEAFAVLTAGVAVTALWVALTANGARAVLLAVRRASRPDGDPAIAAASVGGSSLTDILGSAAGPAACSLSLMASSIGLLVPFLR